MGIFLSDRRHPEIFTSDAGRIGIIKSDRGLDTDISK
jgi:hypothetical protein